MAKNVVWTHHAGLFTELMNSRLHRAAYNCALDLIRGIDTTKYLTFTAKCITALKQNTIHPTIVFDGGLLYMKTEEENKRAMNRQNNKTKSIQYYNKGDTDQATKFAQKAITITNKMIRGFMDQCNEHNIPFVCAPYEADSQLAYMFKSKQINFVITEDSDLLVFGATNCEL
eukprot:775821_1